MAISQRPQNEGFMPKGVKSINDVYTSRNLQQWPASSAIWGFGANDMGQVNGKLSSVALPRQGLLVSKDRAISIASANQDTAYFYVGTMYVRADGTLWAYGFNFSLYLGLPMSNLTYTSPTQVGTDSNWEKIYNTGQASWIGLKNGGEMWSIGQATVGRLFTGNTTPNLTAFTRVQSSFTWQKISVGNAATGAFSHMAALRSDGTIWVVGSNANGKTGLGTAAGSTTVPTQVGTATDWVDVACSGHSISAIKSNGTLWTAGSTLYNVSNGATTLTQLGTDADWASVNGGPDYLMFHIKTNGRAYRSGQGTTNASGAGALATSGSLISFDDTRAWTWKWITAGPSWCIGMRTDGKLFYSGNAAQAPIYFAGSSVTTNVILFEEIGALPPTNAIANTGTTASLFSY